MPTIEQLEKLLTIDPEDPFVHYGIGQERAKLGQHEQAIECFDQALAIDESYCYAYYFKAISLKELGRREDAVEVIRCGIERAIKAGEAKARSELEGLMITLK
ncbi:MAG: tetratricopeptide repeat protein [Phycisphaerales bacterium]|nr:tetratricopeptide repeat protein [Phycisphaerales bacterium]